MPSLKSLAKDTAVYGLSSIIGRFLNWLLVPLYTITFAEAQYGTVSFIYAWVALTLALLIYGMETGFSGLPTTIAIPIRMWSTPLP